MAKRKSSGKVRKPVQETAFFFKKVGGKRQRYVKIVLRAKNQRTVVKQYRWRGGRKELYLREARLPRGSKYLVNYRKGVITKSPTRIEQLLKQVKKKQVSRKVKGKILPRKQVMEKLRIIPKRIRHPPEPVEAKKIVKLLDGKVYYEREHSINDFANKQMEDRFLLGILQRATKKKQFAINLLQNFDKIKLKMSYEVRVMGFDDKGAYNEQIARFSAIGMKPTQIVETLKSVGLVPQGEFVDIDSEKVRDYKGELRKRGIGEESQNIDTGRYRISDVRIAVKFYNNPQKAL